MTKQIETNSDEVQILLSDVLKQATDNEIELCVYNSKVSDVIYSVGGCKVYTGRTHNAYPEQYVIVGTDGIFTAYDDRDVGRCFSMYRRVPWQPLKEST